MVACPATAFPQRQLAEVIRNCDGQGCGADCAHRQRPVERFAGGAACGFCWQTIEPLLRELPLQLDRPHKRRVLCGRSISLAELRRQCRQHLRNHVLSLQEHAIAALASRPSCTKAVDNPMTPVAAWCGHKRLSAYPSFISPPADTRRRPLLHLPQQLARQPHRPRRLVTAEKHL